jgi:phosphoserine phosphatase
MSTTLAIVFDFDDTLAPDSTSAFLASLGLDVADFWSRRVQRLLDDDWDPIPAYLAMMIEESRARPPEDRITRDRLRAFGETVDFFPGVKSMFGKLRKAAKEVDPQIEIEFYLISSGLGDVLRTTAIASSFADIWASDFACAGDPGLPPPAPERAEDLVSGEIVAARNVVSFTEKTRFLFQISKGLVGPEYRGKPTEVNQRVQSGDYRIPFRQMIFVGDGHTDIPCFQIVRRYEGVAFAVYDPDRRQKWGKSWDLIEAGRVNSLCRAKFGKNDELHQQLLMAVSSLARKALERD